MTREKIIELLKKSKCKYAIVTLDVCAGNEVIYPDEKVVVSVLETQDRYKYIGKTYAVFDSIRDFKENSVFSLKEAREAYCRYYFDNARRIDYFYK